jgi:hypothetical protein
LLFCFQRRYFDNRNNFDSRRPNEQNNYNEYRQRSRTLSGDNFRFDYRNHRGNDDNKVTTVDPEVLAEQRQIEAARHELEMLESRKNNQNNIITISTRTNQESVPPPLQLHQPSSNNQEPEDSSAHHSQRRGNNRDFHDNRRFDESGNREYHSKSLSHHISNSNPPFRPPPPSHYRNELSEDEDHQGSNNRFEIRNNKFSNSSGPVNETKSRISDDGHWLRVKLQPEPTNTADTRPNHLREDAHHQPNMTGIKLLSKQTIYSSTQNQSQPLNFQQQSKTEIPRVELGKSFASLFPKKPVEEGDEDGGEYIGKDYQQDCDAPAVEAQNMPNEPRRKGFLFDPKSSQLIESNQQQLNKAMLPRKDPKGPANDRSTSEKDNLTNKAERRKVEETDGKWVRLAGFGKKNENPPSELTIEEQSAAVVSRFTARKQELEQRQEEEKKQELELKLQREELERQQKLEEEKEKRQKERMTRRPRTKGRLYRFNEEGHIERIPEHMTSHSFAATIDSSLKKDESSSSNDNHNKSTSETENYVDYEGVKPTEEMTDTISLDNAESKLTSETTETVTPTATVTSAPSQSEHNSEEKKIENIGESILPVLTTTQQDENKVDGVFDKVVSPILAEEYTPKVQEQTLHPTQSLQGQITPLIPQQQQQFQHTTMSQQQHMIPHLLPQYQNPSLATQSPMMVAVSHPQYSQGMMMNVQQHQQQQQHSTVLFQQSPQIHQLQPPPQLVSNQSFVPASVSSTLNQQTYMQVQQQQQANVPGSSPLVNSIFHDQMGKGTPPTVPLKPHEDSRTATMFPSQQIQQQQQMEMYARAGIANAQQVVWATSSPATDNRNLVGTWSTTATSNPTMVVAQQGGNVLHEDMNGRIIMSSREMLMGSGQNNLALYQTTPEGHYAVAMNHNPYGSMADGAPW